MKNKQRCSWCGGMDGWHHVWCYHTFRRVYEKSGMSDLPERIWLTADDGERCTPYYAEKYGAAVAYLRSDLFAQRSATPDDGAMIKERVSKP